MNYEQLMRRCFRLAGKGKPSPNPYVGCVVLDKNGNIISEGFHRKYGENHAERDALLKLENGEEKDGTLVVNLEPCTHFGKTPPCADLIISRGIKNVIISNIDPNPVAANGVKKLQSAGINVITGVLENEGKILNEVFFKNIEEKLPFLALKTASTLDGKIASKTGDSKWITSDRARKYAHALRLKYDCILTSSATVIADNPKMVHDIKIIIDRHLKTDFSADIYKTGKCYVVSEHEFKHPSIEWIQYTDLHGLAKELFDRNIMSVFVEAGGKLSGAFLKEGLIDKLYYFMAPKILNDNNGKSSFDGDNAVKISQATDLIMTDVKKLGNDILLVLEKRPF